jgi:hypothetical protein
VRIVLPPGEVLEISAAVMGVEAPEPPRPFGPWQAMAVGFEGRGHEDFQQRHPTVPPPRPTSVCVAMTLASGDVRGIEITREAAFELFRILRNEIESWHPAAPASRPPPREVPAAPKRKPGRPKKTPAAPPPAAPLEADPRQTTLPTPLLHET